MNSVTSTFSLHKSGIDTAQDVKSIIMFKYVLGCPHCNTTLANAIIMLGYKSMEGLTFP